ncbi:MAG: hypothetical protein SFT90_02790 [Rickettsiales bacterium]|nr:hypothetical protein [Rickettsiales bacterium]
MNSEISNNKTASNSLFDLENLYKLLVLGLLCWVIYLQFCIKNGQISEETLANQLAIQNENFVKTLKISLEESHEDKTVLQVYKENYSELQFENNSIKTTYEKKINSLKKKFAHKKNLAKQALKYQSEILTKLNEKLSNLSNSGNNSEDNVASKSKEVLSKFVKITKISDIESTPEFLLKKEIKNLARLLINENYSKVSEILSKSSEILNEEKYKALGDRFSGM